MSATPADLRALRELLPAFYGSRDPDRCARIVATLDDLIIERERAVLVFRPGSPGEWVIGQPDAERVIPCRLPALAALHAAIDAYGTGRTVRAAEFAAPGARHPANTVRNGIRRAVEWAEGVACRDLANAMRCVRVGRDDLLRYEPLPSTPEIFTS
jgi:hypothetical protein